MVESELRNTSPDLKDVFASAAARGELDEPQMTSESLESTFGPLKQQVGGLLHW